MNRIQKVDGHYITRHGINTTMGVRCQHGVVDGDKPLSETGPRCQACCKYWYPELKQVYWDPNTNIRAHCRDCGETLHIVSRVYEESLQPLCYAHTAPRGCPRDAYVVSGFEKNFWNSMNWREGVRIDIRDYERVSTTVSKKSLLSLQM